MGLSLFFAAVASYALVWPHGGEESALNSDDELQEVLDDIKDRMDQTRYGEGLRLIHKLGRNRAGSAAERALLEILTNAPNDGVRLTAVRQLGRVGSAAAVGPLAEFLASPRSRLVGATIRALGEIGTSEAVEALVEFLETGAQDLRRDAVIALGQAGGQEALDQLVELASDPFERSRREAITGLGQIGGVDAVGVLSSLVDDSNRAVQLWAIAALGRTGDAAAKVRLMDMVEHAPRALKGNAVEALSNFYDEETQSLLTTLFQGDDQTLASLALRSMDKDTLQRSEEAVLAIARTNIPGMEYSVVDSLARMGTPKAEAALIQMLRENRMSFRAADALAQSGTEESRRALMDMAVRGSSTSQPAAVSMLGQIKGEGVEQALSEVIRSGSGPAAAAAMRTLAARQGADAAPMLLDIYERGSYFLKDEALYALSRTGDPRAKELVLQAARSGRSQISGVAMNILAEEKDPETKDILIKLLGKGDANISNRAAELLGKNFQGDESARAALLRSVKDPHQSHVSSWVMSQMSDPGTRQILEGALQDQGTTAAVKQHIASALANNGDFQTLERMATSADPQIVAMAINGMGSKGNPEMVPILRDALQAEDKNVRDAAITSLGSIGSVEAMKTLESALQDPAQLPQTAAALGQMRSQKATEILVNQFAGTSDSGQKTALINAIALNASRQGEELLFGALQDADETVALSAAQALMNIGGHQEQLLAHLRTRQGNSLSQHLGYHFKYRFPRVYEANKGLFELK